MPLIARRREKPLAELSERDLQKRVDAARKTIERLPDPQDGREAMELLPTLQAASHDRQDAQAELDRRAQRQKDALNAQFRRKVQLSARSRQTKAVDAVVQFAHAELAGFTLSPARLDDTEAKELLALARRRRGHDDEDRPLVAEEENRYIALVERAAGEPGLFQRRRAERDELSKLAALRAADRRHPQADSLVAAVMADEALFEGLQHKLRTDALVLDEYGRQVPGGTACRIYEYENIATLHVVLSLIVANGGRDIVIDEHGNLGDGLPPLPRGTLSQLLRNGWLTTSQQGAGTRVGLGERMRSIAVKWGIDLPPADAD